MEQYKALFLDIDGTILRHDHTIEHSTKEAIKIVQQQGVEVFLATGRPLHEVDDIAQELNINSYIGYNGAYAIYQNEVVVNEPLKPNIIDHYKDISKQQPHELIFYTNELNLLTSVDSQVVKEFIEYFNLSDSQLYDSKYRGDILGITLMNLQPEDPKLYELEEADIYFSQVNVKGLEHCYDVIRENVNKGEAIKKLLSRLQIPASSTIAFGDGMNDKQMLQTVEHSFAMGNATPELLPFAKHKTSSVEDSGIYNGLKMLGLVN